MIVEEAWSVFIVVYLCGRIVAGLNCFCLHVSAHE